MTHDKNRWLPALLLCGSKPDGTLQWLMPLCIIDTAELHSGGPCAYSFVVVVVVVAVVVVVFVVAKMLLGPLAQLSLEHGGTNAKRRDAKGWDGFGLSKASRRASSIDVFCGLGAKMCAKMPTAEDLKTCLYKGTPTGQC